MIPDSPQWTARGRARLEQHARILLMLREPHPTKVERVEVAFVVELRDGTRERVVTSAWC